MLTLDTLASPSLRQELHQCGAGVGIEANAVDLGF